MQPISEPAPISKKRLWAGRVLSALVGLFLLMDGGMKVMMLPVAVEGTQRLGYPKESILGIGCILIACTLLYWVPRTAILGAILLTGYLGGAVATHVRVGDPLFSHILFPVYFGLMAWGGLYLRESRLVGLIPLRS